MRSSTNSGHRQVLVQVCPGLSLAPSERNSIHTTRFFIPTTPQQLLRFHSIDSVAPSTPLVAFRSLTPSSPRQLGSQQKFPVRSRVRPSKPIPRSLTRSAVESSTTLTLFGHVATICRHQTPPTPPTLPTTPFRGPPAPPAPSLPASTSPARPEIPR